MSIKLNKYIGFMYYINDLTPEERKRYDELKQILMPKNK